MWLVFLVVMLNCDGGPFGGVSETVKQPQKVLLSHSMTTVKLSASNNPPVTLSHRISG